MALQEVACRPPQQTADELLGPGYHTTAFSRTSDDGVGGLLATRWPHRAIAEVDHRLREDSLPWAATLLAQVATPLGEVLLAHHKPSWEFPAEAERERQAIAASDAIEQHRTPDAHVVVLGDLDATPDAASTQSWRGRRSLEGRSVCFLDAWESVRADEPGDTFSSANPLVRRGQVATALSRRIDYVFVRSGAHGPTLRVHDCFLVLDQPVDGVWASDHFGVVADLALPEHPPGSWAELGG